MKQFSLRALGLAITLAAAPAATECTFALTLSKGWESIKTTIRNNQDLLGFAAIASIPFGFWAYNRYQEHQKPTQLIMYEAQQLLKTLKESPFANDLKLIITADNVTDATETAVNKHCPGYHFPFLSYAYELKKAANIIALHLWRVETRLAQERPADTLFTDELQKLQEALYTAQNQLITLQAIVKDHDQYQSEYYSRKNDQNVQAYHNYGIPF